MIPPGVHYVTVRNQAKHLLCLTNREQALTMMFHHEPSSEPCATCGQPLDQPAGPPRCHCDQPTCRLCHPVVAAVLSGDITGDTRIIGGAIHDPGDTMPDQPEPVDVPGLGTALVVLGSILGLVTVGAIIGQEWGWRWAGLWLAAVFIVLGALLRTAQSDDSLSDD